MEKESTNVIIKVVERRGDVTVVKEIDKRCEGNHQQAKCRHFHFERSCYRSQQATKN